VAEELIYMYNAVAGLVPRHNTSTLRLDMRLCSGGGVNAIAEDIAVAEELMQ